MDIVNTFFRQFYPSDWDTAWEPDWLPAGEIGRRYAGSNKGCPTIFPEMECADGFKMSVQGHFGAYSQPRDDFAESYSTVEILTHAPEPALGDGADYEKFWIYGYVPVADVAALIESHGGLKDPPHAD